MKSSPKVFISQSRGKEKLIKAFEDAGAEVVSQLDASIQLIIPTVDEELTFMAYAKDLFLSQGIRVMVGNEYTISTCRDKAAFAKFCRIHEFKIPITCQFDALVKPRFGKGSKGQFKIDRSYIVQEVIEGIEYSIDYLADWNGNPIYVTPRIRMDVINGESQAGVICMTTSIIDECKRLGKELGLVGHNTIQGFERGKDFLFTEVNPRFGGGFWLTQKEAPTVKWLVEDVQCKFASDVKSQENSLKS